MKKLFLFLMLAFIISAGVYCGDQSTQVDIIQPEDVDTVYVPIPWGLDVNQHYYFITNETDTVHARLKFVEESEDCENGWCRIDFGVENGPGGLVIIHAPDCGP